MIKLELSIDYMDRELKKGNDVRGWSVAYALRNKIKIETVDREYGEYIALNFNTRNQRNIFVRKGNAEFPYFEFL